MDHPSPPAYKTDDQEHQEIVIQTLRARFSAKFLRHEIEKGLRSSLIPKLCV